MELNIGNSFKTVLDGLKTFIARSKRVMVIAKKPDLREFKTMATVTGIGIIVIAAIAYVVYLFFAFSGLN